MAEIVYYPHATDLRNDIRIKVLRRKFGFWEGYGMWNTLLEVTYQTNHPVLDLSDLDTMDELCGEMHTDRETVEAFIEACIKLGLLEASSWKEYRHVCSQGIVEQMDYIAKKAAAGKKSGEARRAKAEQ